MHKWTDFPSLLWLLIRSSPIWLLCMFLCACAAYGFSAYVLTPSYTSSATLYIYNSQDTARELNAGNVDTSRKLVDTCAVILQSDRTVEQVLRRTGCKQSLEELRGMLTLDSVDHTEILRISVTSKDPQQAALLCNTLVACAPSEILRVLQAGNVKVVDSASVPEKPTSPDLAVSTILGGLLGLGCSITAILVWKALDGHIRTAKDLEECGAPVLAEIPLPACLGEVTIWYGVENQSTLNKRRIC